MPNICNKIWRNCNLHKLKYNLKQKKLKLFEIIKVIKDFMWNLQVSEVLKARVVISCGELSFAVEY